MKSRIIFSSVPHVFFPPVDRWHQNAHQKHQQLSDFRSSWEKQTCFGCHRNLKVYVPFSFGIDIRRAWKEIKTRQTEMVTEIKNRSKLLICLTTPVLTSQACLVHLFFLGKPVPVQAPRPCQYVHTSAVYFTEKWFDETKVIYSKNTGL